MAGGVSQLGFRTVILSKAEGAPPLILVELELLAWQREFKLPWREAGPPNHHDEKVDSDQQVVNQELSLRAPRPSCVQGALRWIPNPVPRRARI